MSKKKVSIIVPVFNTASLLPKCIDSLLGQTLSEIEIILVNDASTDNSLSIMREYENQHPNKIKVIDSKINQRQGGARNLGIEIAEGKYIGFVDSDDWIESNMYELLYNQAIINNSDLCYCYRNQVTETNKISKDDATYFLPKGKITESIRREMLVSHITFVQRYLYKRSIFMEQNVRFPANIRYEDMIIDPVVLLYINVISAVKHPLYNYFIRTGSTVTSVNDEKYKDKISVCRMIVDEYKKRGFYEKYKQEINSLFFRKGYIHAALNYIINTKKIQKETIIQMEEQLLSIDSDYRNNQYYKQRFAFRCIDIILRSNSNFLLYLLKFALRVLHYNV